MSQQQQQNQWANPPYGAGTGAYTERYGSTNAQGTGAGAGMGAAGLGSLVLGLGGGGSILGGGATTAGGHTGLDGLGVGVGVGVGGDVGTAMMMDMAAHPAAVNNTTATTDQHHALHQHQQHQAALNSRVADAHAMAQQQAQMTTQHVQAQAQFQAASEHQQQQQQQQYGQARGGHRATEDVLGAVRRMVGMGGGSSSAGATGAGLSSGAGASGIIGGGTRDRSGAAFGGGAGTMGIMGTGMGGAGAVGMPGGGTAAGGRASRGALAATAAGGDGAYNVAGDAAGLGSGGGGGLGLDLMAGAGAGAGGAAVPGGSTRAVGGNPPRGGEGLGAFEEGLELGGFQTDAVVQAGEGGRGRPDFEVGTIAAAAAATAQMDATARQALEDSRMMAASYGVTAPEEEKEEEEAEDSDTGERQRADGKDDDDVEPQQEETQKEQEEDQEDNEDDNDDGGSKTGREVMDRGADYRDGGDAAVQDGAGASRKRKRRKRKRAKESGDELEASAADRDADVDQDSESDADIDANVGNAEAHENGDDDDDVDDDEASRSSSDDDTIVMPPRPGLTILKQNPPIRKAFQNLDDALEAQTETAREIDDAEEEFERAKIRLEDAKLSAMLWSRTVRGAKREVVRAETVMDTRWNQMYKVLVKYKEEHGHCSVPTAGGHRRTAPRPIPPEYLALSRWVGSQRESYNKLPDPTKPNYKVRTDGQKAYRELQPHRILALEKLGFVWSVQDEAWNNNLRDLLEYKQVHGHVNVPSKYKPNPRLGTWVHKIRGSAKRYWEGKPSSITEDRIKELDGHGFIWKSDFPRTLRKHISEYKPKYAMRDRVTEEMEWEEKFGQLEEFFVQHGHCCVGTREFRPHTSTMLRRLSDFVSWQRKQYILFKEGKPSTLTEERIQRLESIKFFWDGKNDVPVPRGYEARMIKMAKEKKRKEEEEKENEKGEDSEAAAKEGEEENENEKGEDSEAVAKEGEEEKESDEEGSVEEAGENDDDSDADVDDDADDNAQGEDEEGGGS